MQKNNFLLLVFFSALSITGYSQITISDNNVAKSISQLSHQSIFNSNGKPLTSKTDTIKIETSAYLLGHLSYGWNKNKSYPVTYKILTIELDTIFELDDVKKQLLKYDDTNSVFYSIVKFYRNQIIRTNEDLKTGDINTNDYNAKITTYSSKLKEAGDNIKIEREELEARAKKLNDTDILQIKTTHTVFINGVKHKYSIIMGKLITGIGYKSYFDKEIIE